MPDSISEVPGSIEGEQILLVGLKIVPAGPPVFTEQSKQLVFPIQVERTAKATITEEYPDKQAKIDESSKTSLGSMLTGRIIWGFCATPLRPSDVRKGGSGRSGRHSGQEATMKKNCFAELIHGWRGDAITVHPKTTRIVAR